MTKTCQNCNTDNPDNSKFCQNCGIELKEAKNPIKHEETSSNAVSAWWSNQTNGGRALAIVGVCCVGLIILFAIGSMVTPDKNTNTSPPTTTTSPSTTTTSPSTTTNTTTAPASTSSSSSGASGVQVQVIYSGSWSGNYGDVSGSQSVDGTGSKTFSMDNPDIVSAVFQKSGGGSGTLTVNIIKDGQVVETKSTSAEYGVVSVSHSFY